MDESEIAVLEADAFLGQESLPELIRRLLQEHVRSLSTDERIQTVLRARAERAATKSGVLTPIETKRRPRQR